jgi:SAM-dependent methyltransferase
VYEQVPYPELVHPHTHPDRLAVVATLLGMKPARVDRCRVLELGCGPAANLMAMAEGLPGSRFVGIDNSPSHVRRANSVVARLGLKNVRVLEQDIRSPDDDAPFDYVIAHGVYSWVEADVRAALLRTTARVLNDHGIAVVSYNTYPGWYMLRPIRDMMMFHGRDERDGLTRVARAHEILEFLVGKLDPQSNLYAANLAAYRHAMEQRSMLDHADRDASLLHDELAPVNDPVFFHEFIRAATECGLQYVAEADLRGSTSAGLNPSTVRDLKKMASDLISLEQYMDFLTNRAFRQTLLCRAGVALRRTVSASVDSVMSFHVSSDGADVASARLPIADDEPLTKAAFSVLGAVFPRSLSWSELMREASRHVERAGGAIAEGAGDVLAGSLLRCFAADRSLVALSSTPDRFVTTVSERPVVSGLVRLLAAEGHLTVPSRKHDRITLDPTAARVVPFLDGTRDLEEVRTIHDRLRADAASEAGKEDSAPGAFDSLMAWLARSALLES